jgi:hypothetical protein
MGKRLFWLSVSVLASEYASIADARTNTQKIYSDTKRTDAKYYSKRRFEKEIALADVP